ncbi:MAG: hypothetical protein JWP17_2331, partial [Solirubrobacterales bacterium]|nr:hypothetical protein [Solirubrobacterales bacterium]
MTLDSIARMGREQRALPFRDYVHVYPTTLGSVRLGATATSQAAFISGVVAVE